MKYIKKYNEDIEWEFDEDETLDLPYKKKWSYIWLLFKSVFL